MCVFYFSTPAADTAQYIPIWPEVDVVSTQSVGIGSSRATLLLPRLPMDIANQYPSFELEYRRHGSTDWIQTDDIPSDQRTVQLDRLGDGTYEVRVRARMVELSETTEYTPILTFYTAGSGKLPFSLLC